MKRVLLLYMAYPFTIANYFRHALEKRPDIALYTAGAFTGQSIPWGGGQTIPMKYPNHVDLPLPSSIKRPLWNEIRSRFGVNELDLVLCCDAGFHLASKPDAPYAIILTDPHVLGEWYEDGNKYADFIFGMQRAYLKEGEIHLPYACSPDHHYPMNIEKDYDASLIGLHYEQRERLVNTLRAKGYKVLYELGLVYDEYREENNRARIGLNWSSLMDINARTFEIMAMRQIPVINRLPHLDELGLEEGRHYLGFDTVEEAVSRVEWALGNPEEAGFIANNGYQLVNERHTYELRVEHILKATGLI